jgi:hypothetical protein
MSAIERAHADAMRVEFSAVAQFLQETLGQRITAVAAGLRDPKTIGRYARGDEPRSDEVDRRIRGLFQITQILLAQETADTVRAWMMGANPQVNDESPLERLHEGDLRSVLEAARAFAAGG